MLRWERWPGRWRPLFCSTLLLCATHDATPAATSLDVSQEKFVAVEQLLTEKMSAEGIPGLSVAIVLDGALDAAGFRSASARNTSKAARRTSGEAIL